MEIVAVELTPEEMELEVGEALWVQALPYDREGRPVLNHPVRWVVGHSHVIEVSNTGTVRAKHPGTTFVRAIVDDVHGTATVHVVEPVEGPAPVDSVFVFPGGAVIPVGESRQYAARVFDSAGVELTGRVVEWSTPTPAIIELDDDGLARALAPGYGEVRATSEGISAAVGLTVPTPDVPEAVRIVTVVPELVRLWVDQGPGGWPGEGPLQMTARAWSSSGQLLERPVEWSVGSTGVATVDPSGVVTGTGPGATWVRATVEGKHGNARVETYERPENGAELDFYALISARDPYGIAPSIPTTWVDSEGVEHEAYVAVRPGELTMEWSGHQGTYSQRLVLTTWLPSPYRVVQETEYVDSGTLSVGWDYAHGTGDLYAFSSASTPGLRYRGWWSMPGELAVEQTVGSLPKTTYYFGLR
ncbi:MAG: Ig-like domain-containing protein [Gemmatimonadota bacterium]